MGKSFLLYGFPSNFCLCHENFPLSVQSGWKFFKGITVYQHEHFVIAEYNYQQYAFFSWHFSKIKVRLYRLKKLEFRYHCWMNICGGWTLFCHFPLCTWNLCCEFTGRKRIFRNLVWTFPNIIGISEGIRYKFICRRNSFLIYEEMPDCLAICGGHLTFHISFHYNQDP